MTKEELKKELKRINAIKDETKEILEKWYKKLTEDVDDNTNELTNEYKERVKKEITSKTVDSFNKLKNILDEEIKDTYVDGFYFPRKAVNILEHSDNSYHINSYMDLTISDILNDVDEFDTVEQVIDNMFEQYQPDSALSWADNFITVLNKLDFESEFDMVD